MSRFLELHKRCSLDPNFPDSHILVSPFHPFKLNPISPNTHDQKPFPTHFSKGPPLTHPESSMPCHAISPSFVRKLTLTPHQTQRHLDQSAHSAQARQALVPWSPDLSWNTVDTMVGRIPEAACRGRGRRIGPRLCPRRGSPVVLSFLSRGVGTWGGGMSETVSRGNGGIYGKRREKRDGAKKAKERDEERQGRRGRGDVRS